MHKNNAYFKATKTIAKTDYQIRPNADVIIGLRVSFDTWIHFLNSRGRPLDLNPDFQRECFMTQELFLNTAQRYCRDFNKTYIEIEQQIDGLDEIVQKIKEKIENLFIDTHQNPD